VILLCCSLKVAEVSLSESGHLVPWWLTSHRSANVLWIHAYDQDNVAPYETPTPGYDLLNAEVVFTGPGDNSFDWQVYVKGQNLLDEDIRNSTSYLKDEAPQIGLNVIFGVRAYF
jgi:iron complex outermembrane recepter protein